MAPQNILALTLLLAIAAWFVYRIRATPTVQPKPEPKPAIHTCHVRGCGRVANWIVRRHDTGERKWVCIGCRDEGTAWGWWAA